MKSNICVLSVEDDPNYVLILKRAFHKTNRDAQLHFVADGQEAIEYLAGAGASDSQTNPFPGLILLDLNLPKMNGFQVLDWIRSQDVTKRLLVVVLTSSALDSDVNRAYDCGANSYLVKPLDMLALEALMHQINEYWLDANKQPSLMVA